MLANLRGSMSVTPSWMTRLELNQAWPRRACHGTQEKTYHPKRYTSTKQNLTPKNPLTKLREPMIGLLDRNNCPQRLDNAFHHVLVKNLQGA